MGDPRKRKKQYNKPRKSFQKERIEKERDLKKTYGLKNKKELLRAESTIRGKRANARKLLALDLENRLRIEKELIDALKKIGVLRGTPSLDDVLVLTPEALLERRLQTVVWRKGLASTIIQARQFITHGHIAVNGKKVTVPSYIVLADEEATVGYYGREMLLDQKQHVKKASAEKKNTLKEAFEEAKGNEKEVPEAKEIVEKEVEEETEGKE